MVVLWVVLWQFTPASTAIAFEDRRQIRRITLAILLRADRYARKAEMQMLLDANNLACCLQGSFLLKLPGWTRASNSCYQKDSGHRVDAHGTRDFLIRQQFGLCIQDQYQADHRSHYVSLRGETWISRHCLLQNSSIRTTVDKVKCPGLFFQISETLLLWLTMAASDESVPVSTAIQNCTWLTC